MAATGGGGSTWEEYYQAITWDAVKAWFAQNYAYLLVGVGVFLLLMVVLRQHWQLQKLTKTSPGGKSHKSVKAAKGAKGAKKGEERSWFRLPYKVQVVKNS